MYFSKVWLLEIPPLLHFHWTPYSCNHSKGNIQQSKELRRFPQEQFKWKTSMWFTLWQRQFQRTPLWTGKRALLLDRINILFKPERKWTELLPYAQTSENFFDQHWLDILMKFSIRQDLPPSKKRPLKIKEKRCPLSSMCIFKVCGITGLF